MADTRCANPEYQLEVDEMMLEYLVYNTLKAHVDEWNPEYRTETRGIKSEHQQRSSAQTLLSVLDTTIQLFKTNHPDHPFSASTDFYLKLLEFVLLFTHGRGGPSALSEDTYLKARIAGAKNIERRNLLWVVYKLASLASGGIQDDPLLCRATAYNEGPGRSAILDRNDAQTDVLRSIPLVDLIPRFMELSEQITALTETAVSEMWLELASDFMLQAAIEVGLTTPGTSTGPNIVDEALLACFCWGLRVRTALWAVWTDNMRGVSDDMLESEIAIHEMLLPSARDDNERTVRELPWSKKRKSMVSGFLEHVRSGKREAAGMVWDKHLQHRLFQGLLDRHPTDHFEVKMLDYVKNLQMVWAQLNEEPILLQIEQGRLKGLDEEEFHAFQERVGTDEHEANLERIDIPAISKI